MKFDNKVRAAIAAAQSKGIGSLSSGAACDMTQRISWQLTQGKRELTEGQRRQIHELNSQLEKAIAAIVALMV